MRSNQIISNTNKQSVGEEIIMKKLYLQEDNIEEYLEEMRKMIKL